MQVYQGPALAVALNRFKHQPSSEARKDVYRAFDELAESNDWPTLYKRVAVAGQDWPLFTWAISYFGRRSGRNLFAWSFYALPSPVQSGFPRVIRIAPDDRAALASTLAVQLGVPIRLHNALWHAQTLRRYGEQCLLELIAELESIPADQTSATRNFAQAIPTTAVEEPLFVGFIEIPNLSPGFEERLMGTLPDQRFVDVRLLVGTHVVKLRPSRPREIFDFWCRLYARLGISKTFKHIEENFRPSPSSPASLFNPVDLVASITPQFESVSVVMQDLQGRITSLGLTASTSREVLTKMGLEIALEEAGVRISRSPLQKIDAAKRQTKHWAISEALRSIT